MDLTQLKMFCCVAETGSLARAAEQLHRVPSNLTTRLRQLENELGTDLFIREKQRLRLSPMGHNFLCYATRILALSEEALAMSRAGVSRWGRWKAPPPLVCRVCWPPTINIFPRCPYRLSPAPPARSSTAFAPARWRQHWWTGRWSMTILRQLLRNAGVNFKSGPAGYHLSQRYRRPEGVCLSPQLFVPAKIGNLVLRRWRQSRYDFGNLILSCHAGLRSQRRRRRAAALVGVGAVARP